jgi:hypothetical protein
MAKEKSLVEEAIIQMKNLEEAVAENAKGILASTMKEEIKELVKESLTEQEDEIDLDAEMEEPEMMEPEMGDDEEGMEMDVDNIDDMGDEEEDTIDLTGEEDDDEILRVFSLMGPEDNIVVTKDDAGNINLKDSEKEYMIVGEGEEDEFEFDMDELDEEWNESDELDMMEEDENIDDIVSKVFADDESEDEEEFEFEDEMMEQGEEDMGIEEDDVIYEIEFDSEEEDEESDEELDEMWGGNKHDFKRRGGHKLGDVDGHYKDYEDDELDEEYEEEYEEEGEEVMESKMTVKPKGVGMGSPKKNIYSNKPNMEGGFKTVKKKANKTMGTGKPKFEYKEGENLDGKMKNVKKVETKEASRTLGNGSNFRKGGLPKPRAHSKANINIKENVDGVELQVLREKNEEYRKALNVFRNKLNEVAVFNSNLAYATRLFTEHSTSKQEKINILRRFDSVETLKESKNLYKSIKEELSTTTNNNQSINESIERKIENVQSTGSSINLIESKTYENPQFLRMKDLMTKLK